MSRKDSISERYVGFKHWMLRPYPISIALLLFSGLLLWLLQRQPCSRPHPAVPEEWLLEDIPRIIHQSWKTTELPANFEEWAASWPRLHPDWEHWLWTDRDNEQLVIEHFCWFLPTWKRLPVKIMRVDAVRYMYMYTYGGLYVDLDMEARKPVDVLLANRTLVLGALSNDTAWEQNVANAFMASVPRHPFWLFVLNLIAAKLREGLRDAEHLTGPALLGEALVRYAIRTGGEDLTVLPPLTVYNDWRSRPSVCIPGSGDWSADKCRQRYPDSYVLSYWTHSWDQWHPKKRGGVGWPPAWLRNWARGGERGGGGAGNGARRAGR